MITHTWILKEFIGGDLSNTDLLDLFIYNVSPDMLCFHKDISSDMTHGIPRFNNLPYKYRKAAFVYFHLLVDDIAHHGKIDQNPVKEFNPYSEGYTYVKGRPLIEPIMEFYNDIRKEISYNEVAYQAHMVIEMAFDLSLYIGQGNQDLIALFCDSVNYAIEQKIKECSETLGWLFRIKEETASEALHNGLKACSSLDMMKGFMNIEGRISSYIRRFGLDHNDNHIWMGVENLMNQGMDLVTDYKDFLQPTIKAIKDSGFIYPL